MPGQKSMRLVKRGGGSSFLDAGSRRFQLGDPLATASLCGNEEGASPKVSPGPFCLRRLLFCPGNKEAGLDD